MKKLNIIIISILTSLALYSERILKEMIIVYDKVKTFNLKELIKFSYANTDFLLLFILTIGLIIFYQKYAKIKKEKVYSVLSGIMAFLLVFGFSYSVVGNSSLVTGNLVLFLISIIKYFTYYIFLKVLLNLIDIKLKELDFKKIKIPNILKKFRDIYEKNPYKTTIIVILICWIPYIISFYPAILSPDPANQIKQYLGIATHYIEGVNLINKNILITNHHPVFHTFILGGFVKIGSNLGSINLGLFMFICFQLFIVISALTYSLVYLKKQQLPFVYRLIVLLIFSLVPVFPLYALSPVKDTMFGALLVFYLIEIHKLITNNYKIKDYMVLGLLILIMMLVRNNGVYIIVLSLVSLIVILRDKRKYLIMVLLISLVSYEAHNKILLPYMNIPMGSVREMLSVPFQQTARYVKYYDKELTINEKRVIDKILGYETLASRYKPNIADPVKNEFNKDATKEDMRNYFRVWLGCLFKHPGVYFDATINTVYGYFYPNTSNWYIYYNYDERLKESNLYYHYNKLSVPRDILSSYGVAFPYIPIIGAIVNIGFIIWVYMYLYAYLIKEKQNKLIMLILPAFVLLLTCVVGPVNTYFRYMFPLVVSLPLILGLIYQEKKKDNS